jgi:hypothetical protein
MPDLLEKIINIFKPYYQPPSDSEQPADQEQTWNQQFSEQQDSEEPVGAAYPDPWQQQ